MTTRIQCLDGLRGIRLPACSSLGDQSLRLLESVLGRVELVRNLLLQADGDGIRGLQAQRFAQIRVGQAEAKISHLQICQPKLKNRPSHLQVRARAGDEQSARLLLSDHLAEELHRRREVLLPDGHRLGLRLQSLHAWVA